ncbi:MULTISPECIES: hypothetical protein [unclassified Streptomyces]|uniref:hypothetical protein n=1 Tax=unclassified Streptomyces TaxID=2593676 RepID=UPI0033FED115
MKGPLIVIVAGSRNHPDPGFASYTLARLILEEIVRNVPVIVRHGACPGEKSVDQEIHRWIGAVGQFAGVTEEPYPADWDHCTTDCPADAAHRRRKKPGDVHHPGLLATYCPAAGPRRNAEMVATLPRAHQALVFPSPRGPSYGTRNCARLCRQARIEVREIKP